MRMTKKLFSMILAFVMVLGLLPATAFATESPYVYISVSFDGQYIDDKNGSPMVYVPVSLDEVKSIDLNEYGLSEYLYDPDGDGAYETTALQLIIYAHENIYGGSWSDVNFTGGAGSSYFQGGIFGFDENLNYFLNGEFPIDEALSEGSSFAVGATSDHIILEPGDFIDMASFTSYAFLWDSAAGFHLFADENDAFVHNYTTQISEAVSVKLLRSYSNMVDGTPVLAPESGYELFYGATFGTADGTLTTDDNGCAVLSFDQAGTYYLWCNGAYGIDADTENIVGSYFLFNEKPLEHSNINHRSFHCTPHLTISAFRSWGKIANRQLRLYRKQGSICAAVYNGQRGFLWIAFLRNRGKIWHWLRPSCRIGRRPWFSSSH